MFRSRHWKKLVSFSTRNCVIEIQPPGVVLNQNIGMIISNSTSLSGLFGHLSCVCTCQHTQVHMSPCDLKTSLGHSRHHLTLRVRNVHTRFQLVCVSKVVTRSLSRFLMVYVVFRHMWTKNPRNTYIWTCETKRDRPSDKSDLDRPVDKNALSDSSHDQWDCSFRHVETQKDSVYILPSLR